MDWDIFFQVVGYIAAVGTTISFLPQAIKCIRTRDTKNISLMMYILFVFGTACWAAYGIYTKSLQVAIANVITLVLASIILTMKIINRKKDAAAESEKASENSPK
jgi:MtN3 and saliva related transmembrane protein